MYALVCYAAVSFVICAGNCGVATVIAGEFVIFGNNLRQIFIKANAVKSISMPI